MGQRFTDQVVVVTGGAAGLGRAAARAFAEEGAELVLIDVNAAGLAESAEIINAISHCSTHVVDLADESAVNALGATLCEQYPAIRVLYNNAGIAYGEINQMLDSIDMATWQRYLAINSLAPLMLSKALRPALAAAKGVILNQSSMAAYMPATIYGATKSLLNQFTYGMASIFGADGIRVNAIAPGLMETPANLEALPAEKMAQLRGMQMLKSEVGTADDIAQLALFLASDEARFITSEVVSCDAGCMIRGWRH